MYLTEQGNQDQAFLDRISSRAFQLLEETPNPQAEMQWAEERLREANLLPAFLPNNLDPKRWTQECLAQNLDLMDQSIPWMREHDSHPEDQETFQGLILNLCPTEGGL